MRLSLPPFKSMTIAVAIALACMASGCAIGPQYQTPSAPISQTYKESGAWISATPSDAQERGAWWTVLNDSQLNQLMSAVDVSNQNIAAAYAAYKQARALVDQQRSALFPVVSLTGSGGRSASTSNTANNVQLSIGSTWEPDVWGRLGRSVDGASASAQASAADLAAARLSVQGELAVNYFSLRQTDAQRKLLADTITGYQRVLQITQNRYAAGIAVKTDVLQAQTQLANAQADAVGLERSRAQLEHAIAVLIGKAPGDFTLAPANWQPTVLTIPPGMPSTLLQRRPDIAAAERRVAAANEQIGIAQSAFFPNLGLNASYGTSASNVADLFSVPTSVWSLGLSAAQTVFNAGATNAKVASAQAAYDEVVARYRQTVLAAFQQVEDQLAATRVLAQQEELRQQASKAANEAQKQMQNRYQAGQVSYTEVVTAQATALSAQRALVQLQADRQVATVSLIQALGGGWRVGR